MTTQIKIKVLRYWEADRDIPTFCHEVISIHPCRATEGAFLLENPRLDSSVPLTHHDPKDLGLICLVKKSKIHFRILSDFRIQSWIFLKKRTLSQ